MIIYKYKYKIYIKGGEYNMKKENKYKIKLYFSREFYNEYKKDCECNKGRRLKKEEVVGEMMKDLDNI